jgi:hypothetical protein
MLLTCEQLKPGSHMKTSRALLTSVLLLTILAASLWAQTGADTKTKGEPAAVAKDEAVTNDARDARESVRIDNTGIHVGGEEPVDINLGGLGGKDGIGGIAGPLLPIISVLMVFGTPVVIVALFVALRHRRNRMMHETLRAMIEKGVPIPPELLSGGGAALPGGSNGAAYGNRDLRWGLILIALGVGVGVMAGKLGLIPFFIGVALLIVWLIGAIANKRKNTVPQ